MEWKRLAPWNWFSKEQQRGAEVPVRHAPGSSGFGLRSEFERMVEDVFRRFDPELAGHGVVLRPSLDISETAKAYKVRVEVPGIEKGDVALAIEEDALVIRGEKRRETEASEEQYHSVERSYGAFERVLALPADAISDQIDARFRHGVLTVTIPRRRTESPPSRTIDIQHA
jgi:HSP20 family protein